MIAFFLAFIPALIAALPLFGSRFIPTHDGEYHIIRFWQFYKMLSAGDWFPRWAQDLNVGLGVPLFTFNYPLPNYIGSAFHFIGMSFADSFKWSLGLGYLTAVIWYYLFAKKVFGTKPAIAATIIFSYIPYWFVYMYVRGSVGEVWAVSFLMLAFASLAYNKPQTFAIAVGLLILSHNILAMIFVPMLFIIALRIRPMIVGWIAGVGLAAYFWVPALYERQFVVGLNTVNYRDHFAALVQILFPSWGSGYSVLGISDGMSFQIGIVSLLIIGAAAILLFKKNRLAPTIKQMVALSLFVIIAGSFLMTEYSAFLWRAVPVLGYLQFPWRLLSVIMIAVSVLAGFVSHVTPKFGIILALCSVFFVFSYTRPVTYESRSDEYYLSRDWFTSGTSSLGDAFQTQWKQGDINYSPQNFSVSERSIDYTKLNPVSYVLLLHASISGTLIAPIAYYPGWQANIGGRSVPISPGEHGTITLPVHEGDQLLHIRLDSAPWQQAAGITSLLSLLFIVLSFILRKPTI